MQIAVITDVTEYAIFSPEGLSQAFADQELQAIIAALRSDEDFLIRPWCIIRIDNIIGAHITDDPKDLNDIIGLIRDDDSKGDE